MSAALASEAHEVYRARILSYSAGQQPDPYGDQANHLALFDRIEELEHEVVMEREESERLMGVIKADRERCPKCGRERGAWPLDRPNNGCSPKGWAMCIRQDVA